jgi:hypothetical protein
MTITVCASNRFLKEIEEVERNLVEMGFSVLVPEALILARTKKWRVPRTSAGKVRAKIKYDLIRGHFKKVAKGDAVLILNYTKDGVENYIGPNSFLEMGIAYFLGKKIFLLNPIPRSYLWEEVKAMQPVVLNGDLEKINSRL